MTIIVSFPDAQSIVGLVGATVSTLPETLYNVFKGQSASGAAGGAGAGDTQQFRRSLQTSGGLRAVDLKASVLGVVSLGGLIATAAQAGLSPRGPGTCDHNMCERCCNIATSAPYVVCGCHAMRNRTTAAGKTWGASMVGVGLASAVFHGSYGSFREWGRRIDFWTIAAASNLMTRALFPGVPAAVTAAGMLATPFKPFFVSTVNSMAMELKFLAAARRNPKLRGAQRLHAACCLLGLGAFALEDVKPDLPLVHSVWHLLSSAAVASINNLLADVEEEQRLGQGQGRQRLAPLTAGLSFAAGRKSVGGGGVAAVLAEAGRQREGSTERQYPELVLQMQPLQV